MSLRNDKAVKAIQEAAIKRKKDNFRIFGHTALPNKTQTLITLMAVADVMGVPMIDLVEKLLNQGGEHDSASAGSQPDQ